MIHDETDMAVTVADHRDSHGAGLEYETRNRYVSVSATLTDIRPPSSRTVPH